MNKLVSKAVKLIFALSIIFSSAIPMQNTIASGNVAEVVSPVDISSNPVISTSEIQSTLSQSIGEQSVELDKKPEYEVVQNTDSYLMSLALGYDETKSQYGPDRNDPDEGIPDHAYSPFDDPETREACPSGGCDYVSGRVLIKLEPNQAYSLSKSNQVLFQDQTLASTLAGLEITNLTPIFLNAEKPESGEMIETVDGELIAKPDLTRWFQAESHSEKGLGEVIQTLQTTVGIAHAEPDYVRKPVGEMTAGIEGTSGFLSASPALLPGSTTDPLFDQQWHLAFTHVPEAWAYLESQGLPPGGSRDIVVAVIDTGVDYTHPDLAANIWVNPAEFNGTPGVDDDGNGYIDDINGVNTTHPGWDPKDDHGHGTHVAGIIAAQAENQIGGVGIAYNTQIMVLKAAQYSGVLAASDIAEAIYYAVSKGADIINMSFGSYARSAVEEDALAIAFGQAVLVAAAGNDQMVNPPCGFGVDMYPAAYNWVLGVMASTQFPSFGDFLADFSNYDCTPYDSHEYELMAPGVDIWSTLPENQYAAWSGTSMSAPVVSGIAALARTYWSDTQLYTSRFIMGQIAATGPLLGLTQAYQAPDALAAITTAPIPRLNYLQHWVFDTPAVDPINDADGIIDAGEVVNLGIVIRNHWGQASDVTVLLEPVAEGAVYPDPNVTMITDTVIYDPIGSFNWQDNGLIYTEGVITGVENPFQFTTNPDTPNDHVIPFRLTMTARNGFDPEDTQTYSYVAYFYLMVQRGRVLPFLITEDMTLTKDYFWLINNPTLIMEGTTLTVTEGTQIQLTVPEITDPYSQPVKPRLQVEGSLIITGTASEPVELFTGLNRIEFPIQIFQTGEGYTSISYAKISNPVLGPAQDTFNISTHGGKPLNLLDHVYFQQETSGIGDQGLGAWTHYPLVVADVINNCIFYQLATDLYTNSTWGYLRLHNDQDTSTIHNSLFDNSSVWLKANSTGSVFGGHSPNSRASLVESGYYFHTLQNFRTAFPRQYNGNTYVLMSNSNGTLDYPVYHSWTYFQEASHFAEKFGGYPVVINDVDEEVFLWNYITYEATQSNFQTEYPDMTDCGSIWTCWELFSEQSFFVGLTSHNPDDEYRWLNGEPLNYTNWAEGEPSEDPSLQQFVYTGGSKWRSYDRLNGQIVLELPGVVNDEALEVARQQMLAGDIDPEISFTNNAILNDWWNPLTSNWLRFKMNKTRDFNRYIQNNFWGTTNTALIDAAINDFNDDFNLGTYVYQPILEEAPEDAYPFVSNVVLSTATQPDTLEVGAELVTFTVSFNRDMDMEIQPLVAFGPSEPYTDHMIEGNWVSPRVWVGTFQVTPMTGNGYQLMRVQGAVAADDPWLVTGHDSARFRFNIIVSGSAAMNLQATGGEGFVDLSWTQSDFDLLAGFNLYRSDFINGSYNRINSSILPPETRSYRDSNVVPGRPYYYKFTVVKSDMSESDFSNTATATPLDTIPPLLTHTPVTSAAPGQPLTLVATATDNVAVNSVTLFYRHVGDTTYTNTAMVKTTGDDYYVTIEGSLLSSPGVEYYIEATDGISITRNGRAENPNLVTVVDRPVVTIVTPNTGPAAGGTAVTITGSNFKSGASITFGGAAASNVTYVSTNQLTCITPAHIPETVDVRVTNPDAQFGVLLNGFSFLSTAAQISLPNTGGGTGNVVTVPINAANINGMLAAGLTVNFDPTVLSVQSASTGTLTAGWGFFSNLIAPGQYRLSMSNSSSVSGAGTLANIEFLVIGAPGSSSALTISEILLNDGAITVELADGHFSVDNVYNVSGLVSFWNGGAPVSGALLTLTGDKIYSAMSGLDGNYTIQGATIDSYNLTPSKENGDNGIGALDASYALRHDVGLITLTGNQAIAADVNSNGHITSMDASYILQKAAGLISLPFPGSGVVWKFNPASRNISELNENIAGQNFTAILLGDISGSWADPGEGLHKSEEVITAASALLTIPEVDMLAGGTIDVPINLDITDGQLLGADIVFTYDPTHVRISNVRVGSLATGWFLAVNLIEPGVVRIATAGAVPITTDGELINFTVTALGDPGSQSALTLTRGDLNEGGIPSTLDSGSVYIAVPVSADFSATPTSGIAPLSVTFTNLSTGDWSTVSWNFGDGATSTDTNPSHSYTVAGTYTVSLTVTGLGGTDTETKVGYVTVYAPVSANFSATPISGVAPLAVTFTNLSTGDWTTASWDFGDGATSTLSNPSHTYSTAGTYTVTLTVSGLGGSDTETKTSYITVYTSVSADFSAMPVSGVAPLEVAFTNLSTGDWTTASWDFGDGITSNLANPSHTYTTAGNYTVSLTVTGSGGTDTDTKVGYITVYTPVSANFSATPTSGIAPLSVTFTNLSTGDWSTASWDFGDGATSTETNPSHIYSAAGTYTVSLTVTGNGGTDTETKVGYITVYAPVSANFSATPTSGVAPLGITFTNLSTGDWTTASWDFGDGATSTLSNPSHTYSSAGTYTVTLTVSGLGGSDTETKTSYITVYTSVFADFSAMPVSGVAPLEVTFTNLSTGDWTTASWDFGDGATSSDANPSHTYTVAGTYTVSLTVTGSGGTDTETKIGYITVYAPVSADFSATPLSGIAPLSVTFTNLSTGDWSTASWDFGDGATSTDTNPSHTYTAAGTYTVSLTVTGNGGTDTETKVGYITVYAPVSANFSAAPTSGVAPLGITFTNLSTGDWTTASWDFGDGATSTLSNPSHTYSTAGTYTVTLTVSGLGGSDTETKIAYITVYEPVVADFFATPTSGPAPLLVAFTNLSTGDWTNASWDFGDGSTSTLANPSHTYTAPGSYTVTLTATGLGGTDTETKIGYIQVSTLTVSGTINYWNGDKPIPEAVCTLSGDNAYSDTTDEYGLFTISGINTGSYVLTPINLSNINGITAYDAALVLRHAAEIAPLEGYPAIAADVNQSGEISSLDASYILQKSVGLIETFPGITSMWLFDPTNYTYPNLTGDLVNQDFTGILLGDPTGNWSIEGGKMRPNLIEPSSILTISATMPDVNGNVTATIFLDPNGTDTLGLDLTLQYDPTHADLVSISKGDIGDNWIFATNYSEDGVIRLGVADTQPLTEMQSIAVVEFHLLDLGRTSEFFPVYGSVNEGDTQIDMTGTILGGFAYKFYIPVIVR